MMMARKPVGKIKYDTREKSGLGDAQQETHDCEARRACDHGGQARQDAPGDHDPGDPYSGADLFQDHVARDLEYGIPPVKHADSEPEGGRRNTEVAAHGEPREAHIDPIDIGEHIRQDRKRQQTQIDLAHGRPFERTVHCFLPRISWPARLMPKFLYCYVNTPGPLRLNSLKGRKASHRDRRNSCEAANSSGLDLAAAGARCSRADASLSVE